MLATPSPAPPGQNHDPSRQSVSGSLVRDLHGLYFQGLLLLRAGQPAAAAECLAEVVAALPEHQGARINMVRALVAAEQMARALQEADAALARLPDHAELHFARGTALNALGRPRAARDALLRAVALNPSHAPSHLNLGNACTDLDEFETAECHIRTALQLDPTLAEAHASLGFVLTALGRLTDAITACEAAIAQRPDFAQAHWNLASAALLAGDFARGFAEYEWRKRHPHFARDFPDLPGTIWNGGDPAGRTILVRAEQGLGDTIQLARYLMLIAERGGKPILVCAPALVPWLGTLAGVAVLPNDAPLPRYDAWIDQLSLPLIFGTRADTIPAAEGYLRADPDSVARGRARLPPGRKIGLAWAGNPAHGNDRRRSLPPQAAAQLAALCGDGGVSLQVGPRAAETGLPELAPRLTNFAETAALIANLDLVLTVDTAVAHAAGALGVPCWVMLPFAPDWRWMLGRDDTPWYASLRLFRQASPGDWNSVIEQVRSALRRDGAPDRGSRDTRRTTHSAPAN
jgi:tetratricopeptide (TPR) repeat protein